MSRPSILVICGKNKKRSRTAEYIFKHDSRFAIQSAGVSPKSERKISENDLLWANIVLVMEPNHKSKIGQLFRHLDLPEILVLDIPDEYEFMDEELVEILTTKINSVFAEQFE